MFGLFKKKKESKKAKPQLIDLDGEPLTIGDKVLSYRYDLGECMLVEGEHGIEYESIASKERKNWTLMIDAATERQKVKKIDD